MGMLIARTDPDQPKHQGITYFACDMHQDGVDVRPLTEMTGRALFNEVFLTDARVRDDSMIGGKGNGWRVANTTLMFERSQPRQRHHTRCLRPVRHHRRQPRPSRRRLHPAQARRERGAAGGSRVVRPAGRAGPQARTHRRARGARRADEALPDRPGQQAEHAPCNKTGQNRTGAEGNIGKLLVSDLFREFREVGNLILGAEGMVGEGESTAPWVQEITMFSPGPSIYGGTDQIQRNIIGERVLGLPKEPGPAKETPFKDLPKN